MITYSTFAVLSIIWSLIVFGAYLMGHARGSAQTAKLVHRLEEAEKEVPIFDDLPSLVLRYRELATTAAIMHRTNHDYVFIWCKDGIHHGVHVKAGDGPTLVKLLGLKQLALQGAYGAESPRKPGT